MQTASCITPLGYPKYANLSYNNIFTKMGEFAKRNKTVLLILTPYPDVLLYALIILYGIIDIEKCWQFRGLVTVIFCGYLLNRVSYR